MKKWLVLLTVLLLMFLVVPVQAEEAGLNTAVQWQTPTLPGSWQYVYDIKGDAHGKVYGIAAQGYSDAKSVIRYNGEAVEDLGWPTGAEGAAYDIPLAVSPNGTVYIMPQVNDERHIFMLDGTWKDLGKVDGKIGMTVDASGVLYTGEAGYSGPVIKKYQNGSFVSVTINNAQVAQDVNIYTLLYNNGRLYFSNEGEYMDRPMKIGYYENGSITMLADSGTQVSNGSYRPMAFDAQGCIWLWNGCQFMKYVNGQWLEQGDLAGYDWPTVFSFVIDKNGRVWASYRENTTANGFISYRDTDGKWYKANMMLINGTINTLLSSSDNKLWASGNQNKAGLQYYDWSVLPGNGGDTQEPVQEVFKPWTGTVTSGVPIDKEWKIRFSQAVNEQSLNGNIIVKDASGNSFPVNLDPGTGQQRSAGGSKPFPAICL